MRGHPWDAGPAIHAAMQDVAQAKAFAQSRNEDIRPDYPSEVVSRLDAALRELRAAKASVDETERQRAENSQEQAAE